MQENNLQAIWEKIPNILNKLPTPGILLVTGNSFEKKNIMTIGWMELGIVWGKPVISILIRPSRFSHKLLEENDEFTINVLDQKYNEAIAFCGSKSGNFCDKFKETGLTAVKSKNIKTPSIKESQITVECKIIHKTEVIQNNLSDLIMARYYPEGDLHKIITGSILHLK